MKFWFRFIINWFKFAILLKFKVLIFRFLCVFIALTFAFPAVRVMPVSSAPVVVPLTVGGVKLLCEVLVVLGAGWMTANSINDYIVGVLHQDSVNSREAQNLITDINEAAANANGYVHDAEGYSVFDMLGNLARGTVVPVGTINAVANYINSNIPLSDLVSVSVENSIASGNSVSFPLVSNTPVFDFDSFLVSLCPPLFVSRINNNSFGYGITQSVPQTDGFIMMNSRRIELIFNSLPYSISFSDIFNIPFSYSIETDNSNPVKTRRRVVAPDGSIKHSYTLTYDFYTFYDGLSVDLRPSVSGSYVDVFYHYFDVGPALISSSTQVSSRVALVDTFIVPSSVTIDYSSSLALDVPNVWQHGTSAVLDSAMNLAGYPAVQNEGIIIWDPPITADLTGSGVKAKDMVIPGVGVVTDVLNPPIPKPTSVPVNPPSVFPSLDGILDLLRDIWNSIRALPGLIASALASALVGDMILDYSKLNNFAISTVFPFCIPFDFYALLNVFDVPPTPPVFTVNFSGTILGANSVRFDLAHFNDLVVILRYMVLVLFIYGLIVSTYKFIKW